MPWKVLPYCRSLWFDKCADGSMIPRPLLTLVGRWCSPASPFPLARLPHAPAPAVHQTSAGTLQRCLAAHAAAGTVAPAAAATAEAGWTAGSAGFVPVGAGRWPSPGRQNGWHTASAQRPHRARSAAASAAAAARSCPSPSAASLGTWAGSGAVSSLQYQEETRLINYGS